MPSTPAAGRSQTKAPNSDASLVDRPSLRLERETQGVPTVRLSQPSGHAPKPLASRLFSAPAITDIGHLSSGSPVARLNSRQSGIGNLLVAGAGAVAWEGNDLTTGAESLQGALAGSRIQTVGNRPLVGFHGGSVAIALRHVRQLRRALVIPAERPLVVTTFAGASIAVNPRSPTGQQGVLYLAHIGGLLELRVEFTTNDKYEDIWAEFGFQMTLPVSTAEGAGGYPSGQITH
jgi:hypothetical protein